MKNERRAKIIELIGQYPIETQEELAERLEKSGFPVTQATISRDIRELKLTKVSVDGVHQKYTLLQEKETNLAHKYIRVLQDGYLSMDQAENLLVIKTISGMAMANMQAICEKYTTSVKAYLLIPLVSSLFADFINSLVITFFINFI